MTLNQEKSNQYKETKKESQILESTDKNFKAAVTKHIKRHKANMT